MPLLLLHRLLPCFDSPAAGRCKGPTERTGSCWAALSPPHTLPLVPSSTPRSAWFLIAWKDELLGCVTSRLDSGLGDEGEERAIARVLVPLSNLLTWVGVVGLGGVGACVALPCPVGWRPQLWLSIGGHEN